jgi:hypothetical protein
MNNYWPEGEDLDLLGYEAAFNAVYEAAFNAAYEAAFGDDSEAIRRRSTRERRRGSLHPRRSRHGRPTGRPTRRSAQILAAVQNIDDYGGGVDGYDVGGIDDDGGGDIDDYDGGADDYAELAEGLREVLHEDYEDAPPEEMEEALFSILETLTPAEGFNIGNALRKAAGTILPQAGAVIGTTFGGPGVGTAIGGKLGQVAGQALSGRGKPSSAPAPANMAPASPKDGSAATASPKDGSAAAAKVVALTQNDDFIKGLLALALGDHGKQSIPIGKDGQSVSIPHFVDLLNKLVAEVAQDAEELFGETEERLPYYMLDSEGNFIIDPVDPGARAEALYQALFDAQNQRLADEAALYSAYLEFDSACDGGEYDEEALDDFLY